MTKPGAKVATVLAGAPPYFSEDRFFIDNLGKNDRKIAKGTPRYGATIDDYKNFYPGHNKCNTNYSIRELKPDMILQLWCDNDDVEFRSYLNSTYVSLGQIVFGEVFLLKNSDYINWDLNYSSLKYNIQVGP